MWKLIYISMQIVLMKIYENLLLFGCHNDKMALKDNFNEKVARYKNTANLPQCSRV